MYLPTRLNSSLTYTQRADQGIADKNGVLISTTTQFDPVHSLWLFDNGGDIFLMKKPELVMIAKRRLVGLPPQRCEKMTETTLREQLESLVRIRFICAPRDTYPAQRAQRRIRLLVDRNREDIAAAEKIIMAPSSSNKDLGTLKKDEILAFLLSQYEPSRTEGLDGMSREALMKELKEWVGVSLLL